MKLSVAFAALALLGRTNARFWDKKAPIDKQALEGNVAGFEPDSDFDFSTEMDSLLVPLEEMTASNENMDNEWDEWVPEKDEWHMPLEEVLGSMYDCVSEVKFVCYDSNFYAEGGDSYEGWYDEVQNGMWGDWIEEGSSSGDMANEEFIDFDEYLEVSDQYREDFKTEDGSGRKLGSLNDGLQPLQEQNPTSNTALLDDAPTQSSLEGLKQRLANAHPNNDASFEDIWAARSEVRSFVHQMIQDGHSKAEIRQNVKQQIEEQPKLKALVQKKMDFLRENGHPLSGRQGPPGHMGLFTGKKRHDFLAGHEPHKEMKMGNLKSERKGKHGGPNGRKLGLECPNAKGENELNFLVDSLSPQCVDILFRLDALGPLPPPPLPPPFFDRGFQEDHDRWGPRGGHHGGPGHFRGYHGPRHHGPPPPPPSHGCAGMIFGAIAVTSLLVCCLRRCRRTKMNRRRQIVNGQIVEPAAGSQLHVPNGVVIHNGGHGQPQVVQAGVPILNGYPASTQAALAATAPTAAAGGEQAETQTQSNTYIFAPAQSLSF